VLALVLLGLLVDDLVVATETRVCAGHLASAEEGVHRAAVDVGAIAQLDVATAAIAAQHVPAAPLWHHRHHKHANETNRFKIEEKRTQTNRSIQDRGKEDFCFIREQIHDDYLKAMHSIQLRANLKVFRSNHQRSTTI
jgi:hypothetical protein